MGNTLSFLEDTVSLTILGSFLTPLVLYGQGRDIFYLRLWMGMLGVSVAVEGIKVMFGTTGCFGRPAEARACDLFCVGGPVGGRPGFPSGHMTNVTMLVTALWWHTRSPIVPWIGVPWACAMAWSRWAKHCHNWQQIVAGIGVGMVCGTLIT
jgi:membrane-associated phospholipid phosphatase